MDINEVDNGELEYKPYEIKFTYNMEATTVLVAPTPEAASKAAMVILAKNGLTGLEVQSVEEMTSEPAANPSLN